MILLPREWVWEWEASAGAGDWLVSGAGPASLQDAMAQGGRLTGDCRHRLISVVLPGPGSLLG